MGFSLWQVNHNVGVLILRSEKGGKIVSMRPHFLFTDKALVGNISTVVTYRWNNANALRKYVEELVHNINAFAF